jgi:hypothetical protein
MATAQPAPPPVTGKSEIRIVSHSNMFYWWPVWAVGFIMAIITAFENSVLATVPKKTEIGLKAKGNVEFEPLSEADNPGRTSKVELKGQDILIAPHDKSIKMDRQPHLKITRHSKYGVVFAMVLLLVITITNIPLRGLWSVIVIVVIVSLVIILAQLDVWERILTHLHFLDIRINMGGYIFISSILFGLWLVILLFFDQQIYMVFTPGQFRVRLAIGEGEMAYDTAGMTLQKERSDLFRHWILGLGSGDLVVQTAGAQVHRFDLHNVLFVGRKLREIEEMLRSRQVVAARTS